MAQSNRARAETFGLFPLYLTLSSVNTLGLRSSCLEGVLLADARLGHGLYRRWGIKTAREYARIKINGLRLVGGNPDFTPWSYSSRIREISSDKLRWKKSESE